MQTLAEIQDLLASAGLSPRRRLGQHFLHDLNLMAALVDLAELTGGETVLEVGAGTGSLTEELLERAGRVVAVEIDRGLHELLTRRLAGRAGLTLLGGDALAGKHAISPEVLRAAGPSACLVANLPYNIATPLAAQCLVESWRVRHDPARRGCLFDRLVFTVQQELADRLAAAPGGADYGPVSVLVALLGRVRLGGAVSAGAFWPQPKVASRMVRVDFNAAGADAVRNVDVLAAAVRVPFEQRRKQMASAARRKTSPFPPQRFTDALAAAGIDPTARPEQVPPKQFLDLANFLSA